MATLSGNGKGQMRPATKSNASAKIFRGYKAVMVSRAYANELPQEVSVADFLTPFSYLILIARPNRLQSVDLYGRN